MKKALEIELGFFPADEEPAVILKPNDGSITRAVTPLAPQRATILSLGSIASIWSDFFGALISKVSILKLTVKKIIANKLRGIFFDEHESEKFSDESALLWRGKQVLADSRVPWYGQQS